MSEASKGAGAGGQPAAVSSNVVGVRKPKGAVRRVIGSRVLLAFLLLTVAVLLLKENKVFEPSYEDIYGEFNAILTRSREMAERKASADDWSAFEREAEGRLAPSVARLTRFAGRTPMFGDPDAEVATDFHIRRPLIQVGKYHLPKFIASCKEGPPNKRDVAFIETQLTGVRKALDAIALEAAREKEGNEGKAPENAPAKDAKDKK